VYFFAPLKGTSKIDPKESLAIKNESVFLQYYSINLSDIKIGRDLVVNMALYSSEV